MSRDGIIEFLGDDWTRTMAVISDSLQTDVALLSAVNSSVLSHSGKLLRPMIALLMARACGKVSRDSIRFAAAAELLHNATLMHDDVADESDERRGLPSLRAILGPQNAVLVGDFWLARTVELVSDTSCRDEVYKMFSSNLTALAEAEMLQLEKASAADTTEEDYLKIISGKTAKLFEFTATLSAISAGATPSRVEAAREYGRATGIAFQIKDDILDYIGHSEVGKPIGADLRERKITLPLLGALALAGNPGEIWEMVRGMGEHPGNEALIRDFVLAGGGIEYALRRLDEYIDKAVTALSALPDSAAKAYLKEIAEYNSVREK